MKEASHKNKPNKYCMIHLYEVPRAVELIETEVG